MKIDPEVEELFLKRKPSILVVILHERGELNARQLSEKAETTYSHAVRVLNKMEELEVVSSERKGRSKNYTLTDKGRKISRGLRNTFDSLETERGKLERDL